jgi:BirA family biotin operon repressor/biotin-[acetyl-CoA-carboxylase] ligase
LTGSRFTIVRRQRVGSTNQVAADLARAGAAAGTVVVAREQSAGRGRHGRPWHSPPGNLYCSLLLRPARPLAACASLSLVIGLAALRGVERCAGPDLELRLKWPNDLLLRGAKLAGILLEGVADGHGLAPWLVAGLGVNVTSCPTGLAYPATSLTEEGLEVDADSVLDAYLQELGPLLDRWEGDGFAPLRGEWLARAAGLGGVVRLQVGDQLHTGRLADLQDDGSILLESPAGCLTRFTAGELFFASLAGLDG